LDVAAVVLGREEEVIPTEPGLLDCSADALLVAVDSLRGQMLSSARARTRRRATHGRVEVVEAGLDGVLDGVGRVLQGTRVSGVLIGEDGVATLPNRADPVPNARRGSCWAWT
jgi:hypothetical protein